MSKPELSIIIVHYRNKEVLFNCLGSLLKHPSKNTFEVIIIDNDEKKVLKKEIKREFPKIRYFESFGNTGFGAGNNLGASKSRGDYLFFLNPDTEVLSGTIDELLLFAKKRKEVGLVAPLLLEASGKSYPIQGSGPLNPISGIVALSFVNKIFPKNPVSKKYFLYGWDKKSLCEVAVIPGSAMMMPKSVFKKVKGFDPKFFLYFEESDLCKRIKEKGYKIYIQPKAKLIHYLAQSTPKSAKIQKIFNESRFYYFKKHFGIFWAIVVHLFDSFPKLHFLLFFTFFLLG